MRIAVFILLAIFFLGCTLPSSKHVCPDGSVVVYKWACAGYSPERITANPDDYESVFLEANRSALVKAGGEISTDIVIRPDEEVWMLGGYVEPDKPGRRSDLEITDMANYTFRVKFHVPDVPRIFKVGISKRVGSSAEKVINQYNITIIGPVENETMARLITDKFVFDSGEYLPSYWNCTSSNVTRKQNGDWVVVSKYNYATCEDNTIMGRWDCVEGNIITTELVIDSSTGQIIG